MTGEIGVFECVRKLISSELPLCSIQARLEMQSSLNFNIQNPDQTLSEATCTVSAFRACVIFQFVGEPHGKSKDQKPLYVRPEDM